MDSTESRKPRILLVEDDPVDRMAIERLFAKEALPYELICAGTVAEALEIHRRHRADLALLDHQLPDGTGLELQAQLEDTPTVFITSQGDLSVAIEAMKGGAFEFLTKDTERAYVELVPGVISRALEVHRLREESRRHTEELDELVIARTRELAESEERLRIALKASRITVHHQDRDLRYTWVHNPHPDITPESVLGKTDLDLTTPEDAEPLMALKRRVLESGVEERAEVRFTVADRPAFYEMIVAPLRDGAGDIVGVNCASTDVTDRVLGAQALKESEERFRTMFTEAPLGIALIDSSTGRIYEVNPSFAEIVGRTPAEMTEIDWMSITHPDDVQEDLENMARLNAGEIDGFNLQKRYIRPDGSHVWINMTIAPVRVGDESHPRHLCMIEDITRAKETQRTRDLLGAAVEQASDLVIITDTDGTIEYVNPAFERVTGYSVEEALGQNPSLLKSGKHTAEFYESMWKELSEGRPWTSEFVNRRKDGSEYHQKSRIYPITDAHGRTLSYVGISTDITKERMVEEQLRQVQKMEAVGQLAGGVAHDFNNILSVIIVEAQLGMRRLDEDDPAHKSFTEIKLAGDRAAGLTRQLLAFSRNQPFEPVVLSLNELVNDMSSMLRRLIAEDIELSVESEEWSGNIFADRGQIEQILTNLVVNSRDAMPNGGDLVIRTSFLRPSDPFLRGHPTLTSAPYSVLEVEDKGTGIDADVQARMFDPFFTTKERGKGTGLGLATVYGIVQKMEGHIEVESELGVGTTMKIYLPIVDEEVAAPDSTAPPSSLIGDETVLLVEDDARVRRIACQLLQENGYTVLCAEDGVSALEQVGRYEGEIHLLLTDMVMPGMGGREVAERVTEMLPETKVLYMSGYTDDEVLRERFTAGEVTLLRKPFTAESLAVAVRNELDRGSDGQA